MALSGVGRARLPRAAHEAEPAERRLIARNIAKRLS